MAAKPWENKSGCKDPTAYMVEKKISEEEQRVSDFIKAIKILARLCGLEFTEWVKITVKRSGRVY